MCGIVGVFDYREHRLVEQSVLSRMIGSIAHRGPDKLAFHVEPGASLAFAKLGIMDPENSRQPIYSEDSNIVAVINGEIFNHLELREQLTAQGHKIDSCCDVDVLVHLYEEYGMDLVEHLNGQFAFCLLDRSAGLFFAARDPFGICPLFYLHLDGHLILASEIKALLQYPTVSPRLDPEGLDQVFTFPGLVSPRTLFKGIHSIPPGHHLVCQHGQPIASTKSYWDLRFAPEEGQRDKDDYTEELDELMARAVRRRSQADAPIGVYISGGLDSALVAALAKTSLGTNVELRTYSIDFATPAFSEGKYQRFLGRALRSTHRERVCSMRTICQRLGETVYFAECPFKETFNVAALCLAELAAEDGTRVVLAGQGADELFAGYVGYRFDVLRAGAGRLPTGNELDIRERLWGDKSFRYERDLARHGNHLRRNLYSQRLREAFEEFDCTRHPIVNLEALSGLEPVERRSYLDVKLRLSDHLLADHGDRMSMARAVEVRYPFLDPGVVSFVSRLPSRLKINHVSEKFIVREVARRHVPPPILRREKFGFSGPGTPSLLEEGLGDLDDLLSSVTLQRHGIFDPEKVNQLRQSYAAPGFSLNVPFEQDLLLLVLTTGLLMETFGISGL